MGRPLTSDPEMIPITISTSIPYKWHKLAKENGWGWNDCLVAGIALKNAGDDLGFRLKQVEAQNKYLLDAMNKIKSQKRIF